MFITAAAAIRDASSSVSKLQQCTKINHTIETPTGKTKRSIDADNKDAKKERLERYRPAIFYDDDDENTSNPKLEKLINEDKERIERERKEQFDKKKGKKETPREEKIKKKMAPSAEKFKMFMQADIQDQSSASNSPRASSAEVKVIYNSSFSSHSYSLLPFASIFYF